MAGDLIRGDDEGRTAYHYVILYYLAAPAGGELRPGDDVSEVGWFTLEEARELSLPTGMMDILLRAVERRAS
jgi:ADP-ribose pyrophosphatase YjhB (NUDIX family)